MNMADQPGVWGIDVGQCALKAIRLADIEGQVTATNFDYVEHPKILSQPDADPDQLVREALEKFLSRNPLRGDLVAISVPGQSGLARFVKLPPVEEKKITDIVRFEAKQQIPFPLEEVVWDYQKIVSGQVTDGFAMETEIGLFAMKRDMINRSMQHFRDVKVEVHLVQMSPLALCNFVSYDILSKDTTTNGSPAGVGSDQKEAIQAQKPLGARAGEGGKKRCIVALDIGADNSNLVITDGERIIWQRPIPVGGNHFTRALTKEMKLTFAKAEHMKRNATKSPDLKKILASIRPVLNEFVGEVQRSLGYFTNTHRDAHIESMIGLGSAFRLPGLQKFLSEKLQLEVHKLNKLERLSGDSVITAPAFTQNVLSFGVAYGLALQGLKKTKLQTNLLPQEIQFERMIRAKKPWAAAAAAALLLGVAGTTFGYAWQYHAFTAAPVQAAKTEGDNVNKEFNNWNTRYSSKQTEVKADEDDVLRIVMGTDERLNWLMINEFVSQCMPVPALRLDGTFKSASGESFTVTGPDGKDQTFQKDSAALATKIPDNPKDPDNRWHFVTGTPKAGTPVTVIYQTDPGAQAYFKFPEVREAALKYFDRQETTKAGQARPGDEGVDRLIQVNLESAYALFSPDVKAVYTKLLTENHPLLGMDDKQRAEMREGKGLPEGPGWLVELRGYTYFWDSPQFVARTLVDEVRRKGAALEQAKEGNQLQLGQNTTTTGQATAATAAAAATASDADPNSEKEKEKPPTRDLAKEKDDYWAKNIRGHVSHPFILDYTDVMNPEPGQFKILTGSALDSLVGSGGAGAGSKLTGMGGGNDGGAAKGGMGFSLKGGGGGAGGGVGASSGGSGGYSPLISIGQGGGGGKMGGAGGGPGATGPTGRSAGVPSAPGSMEDMMKRMRGVTGGNKGMNMQGSTGNVAFTPKPVPKKATPTRYEFSIIFVWKEWTPSDKLIEGKDNPAAPGAQ
jgi:type IV pilus assembly protein PilM